MAYHDRMNHPIDHQHVGGFQYPPKKNNSTFPQKACYSLEVATRPRMNTNTTNNDDYVDILNFSSVLNQAKIHDPPQKNRIKIESFNTLFF